MTILSKMARLLKSGPAARIREGPIHAFGQCWVYKAVVANIDPKHWRARFLTELAGRLDQLIWATIFVLNAVVMTASSASEVDEPGNVRMTDSVVGD